MELVEGPTLGEQIALAPIPPEDVLSIARQIAEALEAAHEQGIVHRDLKPANVKVKPDGTVKVLDFGLAKLVEASGAGGASQAAGSGGLSMSPTITTPAMTQMGVILGTAAYMSPEQARGAPADRRADVWAFGCVVYEMLTGRAVFEGKTVSDVLAGVLRIDPEWQRLPAAIHPRLRLMLERCLARDPRDRYQGISDARVDIEVAQNDPGGESVNATSRHDLSSRSLVRRGAALALAATVGAALAVVGMRAAFSVDVEPAASIRFNLSPPDAALFDSSAGVPFAVSPDGRTIAFVARSAGGNSQLWLQSLDAERAQPLQGTVNATSPFWSPDSEWIAFYAGGNLKKIHHAGGEPQTITATRSVGEGGSAWSTNGTILFKAGRLEGPWLGVSAQGGPVSEVTRLGEGENSHIWASFLPDGIHFVHRVWGGTRRGIYLASLDGNPSRLLLAEGDDTAERGVAYVPGFLLFLRNGALVARRFDEQRLEVLSEEVRLVDDVPACCGSWDPWSVSANGVVVFWRNQWGYDAVLRWYARDGSSSPAVDAPARYGGFALSPDDRRIAFERFRAGGLRDLWVLDESREAETRLTFDGDSFSPVWSPDGMEIAFSSSRGNVPDVYSTRGVGVANDEAKRVTEKTPAVEIPGSWVRNGSEIVYTVQNPDGQTDLRRVLLPDHKEERLEVSGPYNEGSPRVSPDGRWLAYVTDASGRPEVWLASYPSGNNRVLVSRNGGILPEWRMSDGRELYYVSLEQQLMAVAITTSTSGLEAGLPFAVLRLADLLPNSEWLYRPSYAPTRDGRRFLVEVLAPGARQPPLQVIVNWPALLKD
jgi:serine/threonine protein kinase